MIVSEPIQRPGTFAISLLPTTPLRLLRRVEQATINRVGEIHVFPGRERNPSDGRALWAGVLTRRTGFFDYGGMGLAGYLGTDDGVGPHVAENVEYPSQSIDAYLDALLPVNGITKGTVVGGLPNVAATWTIELTLRAFIDEIVTAAGAEWYVDTAHQLHVTGPPNVKPRVVITPRPTTTLTRQPFRGIRGGFTNPGVNTETITSKVRGYGRGAGPAILTAESTAGATVGRGSDGLPIVAERSLDLPSSDQTELDSLTAASLARFEQSELRASVSSTSWFVRRDSRPGENIYVYDDRIAFTAQTPIVHAGTKMFPTEFRNLGMRWQSHPGLGFYLREAGTTSPPDTWVNLTDWVVVGDGACDWTISTDDGPAGVVLEYGPDRFGTR